jgi:hypothetical protein
VCRHRWRGSLLLLFLLAATSWSVSGSARAAPPAVAVRLLVMVVPVRGAAAVSLPVAAAVAVPAAVPAAVSVALPVAAVLQVHHPAACNCSAHHE